jgi:hypothetical protein
MRTRNALSKTRRFPVWVLPILGIISGIVVANLYNLGALSFWTKAHNSPEKIDHILKNVDGYNLLVETISGDTLYVQTSHCWIYDNNVSQRYVGVQSQPEWDYSANYLMWPLGSRLKQTYDIAYYADGPKGLIRYVLTENGELWYWNFCDNGLMKLNLCFFPLFGLFAGIILVVLILIIRGIAGLLKRTASPE